MLEANRFQKDLSLYLFISGIVALSIVPFLTWFNYGINLDFPSQVSLIRLFENGFTLDLTLYTLGIAATIIIAAAARRPVFFQGIPPIVFPVFILIAVISDSLVNHYAGYSQILTDGVLTTFLAGALLETSYFSYRHKKAKCKSALLLPLVFRRRSKSNSSKIDGHLLQMIDEPLVL